jgi:hypothetical protein
LKGYTHHEDPNGPTISIKCDQKGGYFDAFHEDCPKAEGGVGYMNLKRLCVDTEDDAARVVLVYMCDSCGDQQVVKALLRDNRIWNANLKRWWGPSKNKGLETISSLTLWAFPVLDCPAVEPHLSEVCPFAEADGGVRAYERVEGNVSNSTGRIAYLPDLRVKIPREEHARIVARARAGETHGQIAADYKTTRRRISQIIRRYEEREARVHRLGAEAREDKVPERRGIPEQPGGRIRGSPPHRSAVLRRSRHPLYKPQ